MAANAPPDVIEAAMRDFGGDDLDDCEVWIDNWESATLFFAMGTQWVISPVGGYVGISYPAIESTMNIIGTKKKRRASLFDDVRLMESVALEVLRDRK